MSKNLKKTALIMPNFCCVITDVDINVTKDLPWLMPESKKDSNLFLKNGQMKPVFH